MTRIISFVNYKGGVGKTSLIVNTAAALAASGKRVLLIDLDTQSNASIWLLRLDRWNKVNASGVGAFYSIFRDGAHVRDLIVKDAVQSKTGESILPGLDIIPTTFNLVDLEAEYDVDPRRPHYAMFRDQLYEVKDDYDYILFDCPPNILRASQCGVFVSNEIYVPANPDALSLIGFTLLVEKMLIFHQRSASYRTPGMGKPAQVMGIIFNAIKANVDIEVPKMRMQLRLNQFRNAKRAAPQAKIFQTQVRDATVVRRAVTLGLPVNQVGQAGDDDSVVGDYARVGQELDRLGDTLG